MYYFISVTLSFHFPLSFFQRILINVNVFLVEQSQMGICFNRKNHQVNQKSKISTFYPSINHSIELHCKWNDWFLCKKKQWAGMGKYNSTLFSKYNRNNRHYCAIWDYANILQFPYIVASHISAIYCHTCRLNDIYKLKFGEKRPEFWC